MEVIIIYLFFRLFFQNEIINYVFTHPILSDMTVVDTSRNAIVNRL